MDACGAANPRRGPEHEPPVDDVHTRVFGSGVLVFDWAISCEAEYDEAAARLTGRNGYTIWRCYLAGLAPEDENSMFRARIEIVGDQPVVTWTPDTPELRATRTYTIYGKKTLLDRDWTPVTDANRYEYNFFKVKVRMK